MVLEALGAIGITRCHVVLLALSIIAYRMGLTVDPSDPTP